MNTTPTEVFGPTSKKARLEIIPLIDVIFFLLATFVLFTLSLNKIKSIPVDFPSPVTTPGEPDPGMLMLQTTSGGNFLWKLGNQDTPEMVTATELAPRLTDYKARFNDPKVFIRGDDKATFGSMMYALDQVRLKEIRVSVETKVSATGK